MAAKQTLYESIRQIRENEQQPFYRVLLSGYFNDDEVKKQNMNPQRYLKSTVQQHSSLTGYLYIKGIFYLHLLQAKDLKIINNYIKELYALTKKQPNVHKQIRIVYQTYECPNNFFSAWECDYVAQSGPILIETDKTQQQIADRSFQIYENIEQGAKKKKTNPSHKLANMFLLSNDDMSILISKNFMSLSQYNQMYLTPQQNVKQSENNYPLPPSIFQTMQFLEINDYTQYK